MTDDRRAPLSSQFITLFHLLRAKEKAEDRLKGTHPLADNGKGRALVQREIDTLNKQISETAAGIDG